MFSYRLDKHQELSSKNLNLAPKHRKKNKQRRDSLVWQASGWYTDCDVASLCFRNVPSKIAKSGSRIWFHVCQVRNTSRAVRKLFTQKEFWCSQVVFAKFIQIWSLFLVIHSKKKKAFLLHIYTVLDFHFKKCLFQKFPSCT